MLHQCRHPRVDEARSKPFGQPDRPVRLAQQQCARIRGDRSAIERRPPPGSRQQVQIQTASRYTLSAPGNSSASPKGLVAEELSPIQSPGAATQFEISGLAALHRGFYGWLAAFPDLVDRKKKLTHFGRTSAARMSPLRNLVTKCQG